MKKQVGISNRTLGKHVLLNKITGREAGIMARKCPSFMKKQYTFLDLCAGDGISSYASKTSSPEIIAKHHKFMKNYGINSNVILVEREEYNHARLKEQNYDANILNCDAKEITSIPNLHEDSAMFIHADPNHIEDWPLAKELLINSPKYTTMLATLGCNVGGLKRLPLDKRIKWYERMDEILDWMPSRHDALLVSLRGDKAQWAYLIIGPKAWHDQGIYIKDALKSFNYWKEGIDLIQFKTQKSNFYKERDRLFLTAKELA